MKNKTKGKYNPLLIILNIVIFGILIFLIVYNLLPKKNKEGGSAGNIQTDDVTESIVITEIPNGIENSKNVNNNIIENSINLSDEIIAPDESAEIADITGTSANDNIDNTLSEESVLTDEEFPLSAAPAESRITFTGTGDNVVHECLWMDARNRALPSGRTYNFKPMFDGVADIIAEADIAFINQETPLAGSDFALSGYPLFNSPQELGYDLVELGFDVINIATNHMIDKGEKGYINNVNFLRSFDDAVVIGGYLNSDELYDIKVVERGGIKIAFLAYTYGTNGLSLPQNAEVVVPYLDDDLIISQIAIAKESADAVIVSVHWGEENVFTPTDSQRRFAQLMADHGVLAIIGHHPHVLQPIEWIEGSGGNRTLCVYSLGNLASGMTHPMNMIGGFIGFDIVMTGNTVTVENPVFTPTIYYYAHNWLGGCVYLLKDYTPELSRSHGTFTRHGFRDTIDDLWGYVTRTIDAEFLS